jgi:lipoprotein-releasing system permease protein
MLAYFFFKKYLFSRRAGSLIRTISWISLLGVAMGVLSLIVVVSVMAGFHEVIRERLMGLEPHVVVTFAAATPEERLRQNVQRLHELGQSFGVLDIVRVYSQDLIVRTLDGVFSGGLARGYDARDLENFFARVNTLNQRAQQREERGKATLDPNRAKGADLIETTVAPYAGVRPGEHEVVLGVDLARTLGALEGDQVLLIPPEGLLAPKGEMPLYERATVVGRVSTRVSDLDSKLILYDTHKTLLRMVRSPSREKAVEVRLKDTDKTEAFKAAALGQFPAARVESWRDRNEALFFALRMEKLVMTMFLGLSGLITSFSIVSVLSLLISQKRTEIGLMMAMGCTAQQMRQIFVGIGFLLSSGGIGLGLTLGLILCAVIDRYPLALLPDIYYDSTIPVLVTPELLSVIVVMAILVAAMSAYLPARTLTRWTPAETIRRR